MEFRAVGSRLVAALTNLTPFAAQVFPSVGFAGEGLLVLGVAARYRMPLPPDLHQSVAICEDQPAFPFADRYWGDPATSSLRLEGQATHARLGTDVYLEGYAWAPAGRAAECIQVAVRVGALNKCALVFGDRRWRRGVWGARASAPTPLERLPLLYERAFGGDPAEASGEVARAAGHNPVGQGLYQRPADAMDQALPNIEKPSALVSRPVDRPEPVGFGPVARS